MKYSVGQTLYLAGRYESGLVTVDKIDRKFATFLEIRGKVEMESDRLEDNGLYLGKLYLNEQEYKDFVLKSKLLRNLGESLIKDNFKNVSLDQVKQVYKILGVTINESRNSTR